MIFTASPAVHGNNDATAGDFPCSSSLLHVNQPKVYKGYPCEWGSTSDNNVTAEGDQTIPCSWCSTNIVQLSTLLWAQIHIQFLEGPTDLTLHQNNHFSSTAHPVSCSVGTLHSFPRVCRTTHRPSEPRLTMSGGTITPPTVYTVLTCRDTALLVTIVQTGLSDSPCSDRIFILNALCKFCHAHQCFLFSNTFQDLFLLF